MGFKNKAQEEAYKKVEQWLPLIVGEDRMGKSDDNGFWFLEGSTFVYVRVVAWGEDEAIARCYSWVVADIKPTPELMQYLLRTNSNLLFGAFNLEDDGTITFEYSIIGSTMDKVEFKTAIKAVASTADKYDNEIVSKFGGKSAVDKMREVSQKEAQQEAPSKL